MRHRQQDAGERGHGHSMGGAVEEEAGGGREEEGHRVVQGGEPGGLGPFHGPFFVDEIGGDGVEEVLGAGEEEVEEAEHPEESGEACHPAQLFAPRRGPGRNELR